MEINLKDKKILALSWKQPFAELMFHGKIETRTWSTNYRGLVLICASKKPYCAEQINSIAGNEQYNRISKLVGIDGHINSHAIAIANLVDCRPMQKDDEDKCFVEYMEPWEERMTLKNGNFYTVKKRLYCHIYEDITPISPFEWKGSQKWKKLDAETIDKISLPF